MLATYYISLGAGQLHRIEPEFAVCMYDHRYYIYGKVKGKVYSIYGMMACDGI